MTNRYSAAPADRKGDERGGIGTDQVVIWVQFKVRAGWDTMWACDMLSQ